MTRDAAEKLKKGDKLLLSGRIKASYWGSVRNEGQSVHVVQLEQHVVHGMGTGQFSLPKGHLLYTHGDAIEHDLGLFS